MPKFVVHAKVEFSVEAPNLLDAVADVEALQNAPASSWRGEPERQRFCEAYLNKITVNGVNMEAKYPDV